MKTKYRVVRTDRLHQHLTKEWTLFGIPIWSKIIDTEEIPSHVAIALSCFGDTSGWISKFAPFNKNGEKENINL